MVQHQRKILLWRKRLSPSFTNVVDENRLEKVEFDQVQSRFIYNEEKEFSRCEAVSVICWQSWHTFHSRKESFNTLGRIMPALNCCCRALQAAHLAEGVDVFVLAIFKKCCLRSVFLNIRFPGGCTGTWYLFPGYR
jgi:hypothetical protein